MLILFLKSLHTAPHEQIPLPEKLRRILLLRVKEAKTEEDRERARRDLAKFTASSTHTPKKGMSITAAEPLAS